MAFNGYSARCGTRGYFAPEIMQKLPFGVAVDIWSLGVVLYAALTNIYPFPANEDPVRYCACVACTPHSELTPYAFPAIEVQFNISYDHVCLFLGGHGFHPAVPKQCLEQSIH